MAKAQFIAKARKPIYENGKTVQYVSQRGKNAGMTLTKVDYTQPATGTLARVSSMRVCSITRRKKR